MKNLSILFWSLISAPIIFCQAAIPRKEGATKQWYFLDTNFNKVLSIKAIKIDSAGFFNEGLAIARDAKTKLWGYINEKGNWQIKPQFNEVGVFIDGYAIVFKKCNKCNKNLEGGLVSDFEGYVIDKNGLVKFTDYSQEGEVQARMFLQENIGFGLFTVQRAWSLGEKHCFINVKGEILSDDIKYYGLGAIYFEPELNAIKCGSIYYDFKGKVMLDLSKYNSLEKFYNGYVWGMEEVVITEDSIISYKVLLDKTGKALIYSDQALNTEESNVRNGKVTFLNIPSETRYEYDIATESSSISSEVVNWSNQDLNLYDFGTPLKNGTTPIYELNYENVRNLVGLRFNDGRIKLFSEVEIEE